MFLKKTNIPAKLRIMNYYLDFLFNFA